jgi:hypothetical protein
MPYSKRYTVASPSDSDLTSAAYLVQDWWQVGFRVTGTNDVVQGAMTDGFGSAVAEADWSTLTTVGAAGAYALEPGSRWLRFVRAASTTTVELNGLAY